MTKVPKADLISGANSGKLVSFPTDTVPAVAALPEFSTSIFALKDRPEHKPLILMGALSEDLWPYVTGTPRELEIWQEVANKYWPGALTLVLPASALVPVAMHPNDPNTIGIRVPNESIAREILSVTGPLATTSANRSGEAPIETMSAIEAAFPDILVFDDSEFGTQKKFGSGLPSTVAKWTGEGWVILRQGIITEI